MNKKGMTLIESVVTIALLGVIFLLATPLIRSFGGVSNRTKTQKEIDSEFSIVNEFIQEKIRSAKSSSTTNSYARIYLYEDISFDFDNDEIDDNIKFDLSKNEIDDGTEGNILFLEIPIEDGDPVSTFLILENIKDSDGDTTEIRLVYREGISDGKQNILMEKVEEGSFKFDKGIIVYHINLDIGDSEGKFRDSLRGSASTRIDIQ